MLQRLLVVEDDRDLARLIAHHATTCGAQVQLEVDGQRAFTAAQRHVWDLIILDWMLPGLDGPSLCRQLRSRSYTHPIMLLTARESEADRVRGLDAGADDYVAKPFSVAELKARIRAQLRRSAMLRCRSDPAPAASRWVAGEFVIDTTAHVATRRGRPLALTNREFDLLAFLLRHPGRAFQRQQLLAAVWGPGFEGFDHTVNSHINRLRAKIEDDPAAPRNLVTVWGQGYRFDVAPVPR
jgi:DNA-binding response OmpR family regulator